MGLGGISIGQLLLIALIVALLFGTKKLGSIGEDLGKALQGFRKGLREANGEGDKDKRSSEAN